MMMLAFVWCDIGACSNCRGSAGGYRWTKTVIEKKILSHNRMSYLI